METSSASHEIAVNGNHANGVQGNGIQANGQGVHPPNFTVNRYSTKKTISNGAFNIALLASNAHELKVLIQTEEKDKDELYYLTFTLVCISLLFQLIALVLTCVVGASDANNDNPNDSVTPQATVSNKT